MSATIIVEQNIATAAIKLPAQLKGDGNTFNIVRLAASLLVIFAHSFTLLGKADKTGLGEWQGPIAVWIFFVISGYLVTGSFLQRSHLGTFLFSRVLRVWPALIAVTFLSAFAIGPLVTSLSPSAYFASAATYDYLNNVQLLLIRYGLPGVFDNNIHPGVVNGSLWTIPLEVIMYLCTACLGVSALLQRRYLVLLAWIILLIGSQSSYICTAQFDQSQPLSWLPSVVSLKYPVLCYFSGTVLYLFREKIRPSLPLALALLAASAACFNYAIFLSVAILLPLAVLTFALRPTGANIFSKLGDYSYGIYLWAFPVQQLLVHFYSGFSFWSFFILASVISIICGALSWHLIEKPSLSIKRRFNKLEGRKR